MSKLTTKRVASVAAVSALALGGVALPTGTANADWTYTPVPQSQMTIVDVSSIETSGEGANGAAALVLDGNDDTYWHSKWQGGFDPFPHHLTVDLGGDEPVNVGQVRLGPRLSSNGSGRIHEYAIHAGTGACDAATFTEVATGEFPGDLASRTQERIITLEEPVLADCIKVEYISAWGGASGSDAVSPVGQAASLAELNVDAAQEGTGEPVDPTLPQPIEVVVPEGAVELTDGDLTVRLHPAFPQVVDYRLDGAQLAGRLGAPLTSVLINEVQQAVTVAAPVVEGATATYAITFPGLEGVSVDAVASVADGTFRLEFANLVDPDGDVQRLRIPNHDLVTVGSADTGAALTAGMLNVNRTVSGDRFENIAATAAGNVQGSWMVMANSSDLAAAFETNAVEDNTGDASTRSRVGTDNNRFQRQIRADGPTKYGTVWSGTWTWLGQAVVDHADAEGNIARDDNPFVEVKVTADANADGIVDWQDAGVAARDIFPFPNGSEDVPNEVISRIPFNIVSQATHPFLRTLDDTKRISLATDNLRQKVLLKGYQDQGHDSAHPDYAGNYNDMAGGLEDLNVLAEEGEDFNARFGVHVNATETYSEAYAFSEDLLRMPPQKAWGWMNQSYYIDGPKDLATGEVLKRFQQFWDERPENLDWLYMDVYYPNGWEAQRFGAELADQGWVVSSEWSDKLAMQNIWSHWSQEESYGGQTNKGIQSNVIRFVLNSTRDTWNPHPILSNSNLVDFEGWTGHNNYNGFINNVWQRNLPVKFLQQSDIMTWSDDTITFANGTVATSDVTTIGGGTVPTDRTFTYDGAVVYTDGAYLLPWTDGGDDRLYHYNIGGGSTTWELTDSWSTQESLTLFELTDTGRVEIGEVTPVDGSITLEAENGVAYVLYPTSDVPAPVEPNWGQGSGIEDPGFFSGTLDAYETTGDVSVVKTARGNFQAQIGAGEGSLTQSLDLPAGTYSAWAWVEVERGKQRLASVEATGDGVTPAGYAEGTDGSVVNEISASTVTNSTASDEKRDFGFQRLRVTFTTDGSGVDLTVRAGGGDAIVSVDDLRVVEFTAPVDSDETPETVFFEDYENTDTGYFPFVTGATNRGGDARTQLARLHAPYSQKGWWGVNTSDQVVQGGKLNDNVLEGDWSLMLNNENTGEVLKTAPGAIPFKPGHEYRVSFDYQTTYADQFRVRLGSDVPTGTNVVTTNVVQDVLGQQRETATWSDTFVAEGCGEYFIAIDKLAGQNTQHNMTIDSVRVEDLGRSAEAETCVTGAISVEGGNTIAGGDVLTVTTTITSLEDADATDVAHELDVPNGWVAELVNEPATTLSRGEASTGIWRVESSREAVPATLTMSGTATVGGETLEVGATVDLTVIAANDVYLSDMTERFDAEASTNGWGPAEWDLSNGEQGRGDGTPIRLRGVEYDKGIGTHANASVVFDLSGLECTAFQAIVGIDDIQATRGSVTFSVYGDGELLGGPTAELVGNGPTHTFFVDITGVDTLRLVADAGANNGNDHADWALARVSCGEVPDPEPTPTPTPTDGPTTPAPTDGPTTPAPTTPAPTTPAPTTPAPTTPAPTTPAPTKPAPTPTPSRPTLDLPAVYTTPGYHAYNGRQWITTCEPYSQTFRCRTEIWATVVKVEDGRFVNDTGWHFNNLTYLPSARSLWTENPLGQTTRWTATDGRQWYTECDTANTGRNGCRSYTRTQVVESTPKAGGGFNYSVKTDWVFNNMVLFS